MTEYTVYFATVCGLLKLRFNSRPSPLDLGGASYRTPIMNPIIFCGVTLFITVQSTLSHGLVALIIFCMLASGTIVYRSLWWQQLVKCGGADDISQV